MSRRRPRQPCPSGKHRYHDHPAAMAALDDIHRDRRMNILREKTEQRAYPCDECRGWHLTSQRRW